MTLFWGWVREHTCVWTLSHSAGLKITPSHWTMSGQNSDLMGKHLLLLVMLSSHVLLSQSHHSISNKQSNPQDLILFSCNNGLMTSQTKRYTNGYDVQIFSFLPSKPVVLSIIYVQGRQIQPMTHFFFKWTEWTLTY